MPEMPIRHKRRDSAGKRTGAGSLLKPMRDNCQNQTDKNSVRRLGPRS
jgi:hypothetical protein